MLRILYMEDIILRYAIRDREREGRGRKIKKGRLEGEGWVYLRGT